MDDCGVDYVEYISKSSSLFASPLVCGMNSLLPYDIYNDILKLFIDYRNSSFKVLIPPEEEGLSGEDRESIFCSAFPQENIPENFFKYIRAYYQVFLRKHNIFNHSDLKEVNVSCKFNINKVHLYSLKAGQYKSYKPTPYSYHSLIYLKIPDKNFFRNSTKNGRLSFLSYANLINHCGSSKLDMNVFSKKEMSLDYIPEIGSIFFIPCKYYGVLQYPFFKQNEGFEDDEYLCLSLYIN